MVSIGAEWHQGVSALECQNEELVRYIETMEREHKEERTKFNEYMDKIQRCFPHVEKLLLRLCNGSDRKHVNGEMG
ncbi:hypothetical protein [Bacteroides sp. An322]|uniref:hypothetical protein n=1 Tax=Bacteroides sp. An322 TaxID=1965632 RepID=UPI000B3A1D5B|nr:hypothetical protein [Bacteroides sp. An322]OUO19329.1 hypothetical protein B5F91_08410 [Bacteroides sp. An322]